MTKASHPAHGIEDLCTAGTKLYERALREGRLHIEDTDEAPCLVHFGLLQPDVQEDGTLRPVSPSVALPRLLHAIEEDVTRQRRRGAKLADAFEPFITLDAGNSTTSDPFSVSVLDGFEQINARIDQLTENAFLEALAIQPGRRSLSGMDRSTEREQGLLDRGGRIRTLYQHTQRHSLGVVGHYERLRGDAQVRTVHQLAKRLLVFDRRVALLPGSTDRSTALEIRHPAIVEYLVATFEQLWDQATPMYPQAVPQATVNGITPRQQAIAALLIEGHTDATIADRLGMNIRTARVHIAKLATTLGSESRAQLGYLIGQSGILETNGAAPPAPPDAAP